MNILSRVGERLAVFHCLAEYLAGFWYRVVGHTYSRSRGAAGGHVGVRNLF